FLCPRCGARKTWPVRGVLLQCGVCGLCLSEIPAEAGVGRRIVAANQVFEPRFVGSNGEAREVHAAICEQNGFPVLSALRIGTPVPGQELHRGLLHSGCASLAEFPPRPSTVALAVAGAWCGVP